MRPADIVREIMLACAPVAADGFYDEPDDDELDDDDELGDDDDELDDDDDEWGELDDSGDW